MAGIYNTVNGVTIVTAVQSTDVWLGEKKDTDAFMCFDLCQGNVTLCVNVM